MGVKVESLSGEIWFRKETPETAILEPIQIQNNSAINFFNISKWRPKINYRTIKKANISKQITAIKTLIIRQKPSANQKSERGNRQRNQRIPTRVLKSLGRDPNIQKKSLWATKSPKIIERANRFKTYCRRGKNQGLSINWRVEERVKRVKT